MTSIRYEKDSDNIAHLIFDNPTESANIMNADFRDSFAQVVKNLREETDLAGVILSSAKSSFFVMFPRTPLAV